LFGLASPQPVARVGHEDGGNAEISVVVDELLEGARRKRQNLLSSDNDPVNVEEKAKVNLL
jgi:hypothetical protein